MFRYLPSGAGGGGRGVGLLLVLLLALELDERPHPRALEGVLGPDGIRHAVEGRLYGSVNHHGGRLDIEQNIQSMRVGRSDLYSPLS